MKKSLWWFGSFAVLQALAISVSPVVAQTAQQEVRLVYSVADSGSATSSGSVAHTASLLYSATDNAPSTGLGIRVHFNSDQVQIAGIENLLQASSVGLQVLPDTQDLDGDSNTDQYINAAWVDLLGQWPGAQEAPVELFTIAYVTLPGLEQSAFSVTHSGAAVGFDFVARVGE